MFSSSVMEIALPILPTNLYKEEKNIIIFIIMPAIMMILIMTMLILNIYWTVGLRQCSHSHVVIVGNTNVDVDEDEGESAGIQCLFL